METMCQIIISNDLEYIDDADLNNLRDEGHLLSNKINSLRNSQLRRA